MPIVRREDNEPEPRHTHSDSEHTVAQRHRHQHAHEVGYQSGATPYPPVNVSATDKGLIVRAELCLEDIDDLELALSGSSLIIRGARDTDPEQEDIVYHRRERGYGTFHRAISLPAKVEEKGVKADYTDGVLTIVLPRTETEQPRHIAVKPAKKRP